MSTANKLQIIAIALLLALAAPALADMYRWVDDRGRVHYGDRPGAAALSAERRADLIGDVNSLQSSVSPETLEQVRERARARIAALEGAQLQIVEAGRLLAQARHRKERGVEPLPGERRGLAGGGSRLAPSYHERQTRLEEDIRRAQAQLEAALAAKNALR